MKKINFLGFPINVMDDKAIQDAADSKGQHQYLVMRVADTDPDAGSFDLRKRRLRTPCEGCQEICWFDPKSFDSLRGMTLTILCSHCVLAKVKEEQAADG